MDVMLSTTVLVLINLSLYRRFIVANPNWVNKYLRMTPEVRQIFNDLDAWCNYCRFRMIKYDPADLYRSPEYKEWMERRKKRQQWQARNGHVGRNNYNNNRGQ